MDLRKKKTGELVKFEEILKHNAGNEDKAKEKAKELLASGLYQLSDEPFEMDINSAISQAKANIEALSVEYNLLYEKYLNKKAELETLQSDVDEIEDKIVAKRGRKPKED